MKNEEHKKINVKESLQKNTDSKTETISNKKKFTLPAWADFSLQVVIVIAILAFIRIFIFLPFNVDGPSMEPTLHNKEFIYVDKLVPSIMGYDYGDVVVFYPPAQGGEKKKVTETGMMCLLDMAKNILLFQGKEDPCSVEASFVKRIVALPGDSVEIKNGNVYVTPKEGERTLVSEEFLNEENKGNTLVPAQKRRFQLKSEAGKDFGVVPENSYFVLGDNRMNSSDSRAPSWDTPFVNHEEITGIVRGVYLSPPTIYAQESKLATYWESLKNIPKSFTNIRWIGDENILDDSQ